MIRSMTGYGRASFSVEARGFVVELRCVNHRYLDARVRLPRMLSAQEALVKERIRLRLGRGKVDMTVSLLQGGDAGQAVALDDGVARQYVAAARKLKEQHGLAGELDVSSLLGMPGVTSFSETEVSEDAVSPALLEAVDEALSAADAMRQAEGEALAQEFAKQLARVEALTEGLRERAGVVQETVRAKLAKRADQIRRESGVGDESRLHQEIVLAADRMDINEELVRLRSHIEQFREILGRADEAEPVGRRLDFLLQEMAREANTVGSKASDAPIAHDVVELKTELERIREQVQNVE